MGVSFRPESVRAFFEVCFEYRFDDDLCRSLNHSVLNYGYSQRAFAAVFLGYVYSLDRRRLIGTLYEFLFDFCKKFCLTVGFNTLYCLAVNPRASAIGLYLAINLVV